MKSLLLLMIRLYWIIPKRWSRRCIFKESCSLHVFKITKEKGFVAGLKAFKNRYKQCKPNYSIYVTDDKKEWIILEDKSIIERDRTNL